MEKGGLLRNDSEYPECPGFYPPQEDGTRGDRSYLWRGGLSSPPFLRYHSFL